MYKDGSVVFLIRHYSDGPDERTVHPAAKGWIDEAVTLWGDLQVEGSSFRPLALGYPGTDEKRKL